MSQTNHRIAILSDTHGLLRPEVAEVLRTCEMILHGGDMNSRGILDELEAIAPVYVVRGNNDKEWAQGMAQELAVTLFGLRIYMIHNKKQARMNPAETDLFIYGHSHKYEEKMVDGVRYLNPGSCGPRRFHQPVTMAILEVREDTGQWKVEKIDLTGEQDSAKEQEIPAVLPAGNEKRTVEIILKEMKAGRSVEAIADRIGIASGLVEQICRIYVTHPGVDSQGIIDKMEVNALISQDKRLENRVLESKSTGE